MGPDEAHLHPGLVGSIRAARKSGLSGAVRGKIPSVPGTAAEVITERKTATLLY